MMHHSGGLRVAGLPKSQVRPMLAKLDEVVEGFRSCDALVWFHAANASMSNEGTWLIFMSICKGSS
jgi:hypothetical protein